MTHRARTVVAPIIRRLRPVIGWRRTDEGSPEDASDAADGPSRDRRALEVEAERARYHPSAADFAVVIDGLDSDDPAARRLATKALATAPTSARPAAADAVPALVRRLDEERLDVRRYAAEAIARLAPANRAAVESAAPSLAAHLSAHNLWVSRNVAEALSEAAASSPNRIAPLVFEYVDPSIRGPTRSNAVSVLHAAATESPGAVTPVVPDLVELLERGLADRSAIGRTLACVADTEPSLVAPAVPELVARAGRGSGDESSAAITALARLALADPSPVRSAVPALTNALADDDAFDELVPRALVRVLARYPDDRDRALDELAAMDGMDRLRAARRLTETDDPVGVDLAETALDGSPLRRFVRP